MIASLSASKKILLSFLYACNHTCDWHPLTLLMSILFFGLIGGNCLPRSIIYAYFSSHDSKKEKCKKLGAHYPINVKKINFEKFVKDKTNNEGVDFVLDIVGADYLQQNIRNVN